MIPRLTRRRALILATATAATTVALTGGAYAYWNTGGSGTGSASTGTMTIATEAVLASDATGTTTLLPGSSADAVVKVHNPNPFAVTLVSVAGNGSVTSDKPGCSPTGVSFTTTGGLDSAIDAGATKVVPVSKAVSMNSSSPAACQGATFNIPAIVTVQR